MKYTCYEIHTLEPRIPRQISKQGEAVMPMQNKTPEKFRDCLEKLMEDRGLSAGQLADVLQYKSKTTLLRVLQDKAGVRCIGNVFADLCRSDALALTEEEQDCFQVAYDVERWGLENYRARSEMWRLLRFSESKLRPMHVKQMDGSIVSLETFFNRFVPCTDVSPAPDAIVVEHLEMYVLSSGYPYVMQTLAGLLGRLGNRIHVHQLLQFTGDTARTVRLIRNLLPVLGYHNHEVFYIRQEDIIHDPIYSFGIGRALILQAKLPGGAVREFQLLIRDEQNGTVLEAPGLWQYWEMYLAEYNRKGLPVKSSVPDMWDYESMLTYYGEIEKDREILLFSGDVCFDYVPVDILISAVDVQQSTDEMLAQLMETLPRLRATQEKRYQNATSKRKPTHWVASAHILRGMASSGVMRNHFFGMRPFTVEERIRIFKLLLHLAQDNPYFHMYLLCAEDETSFLPMDVAYMVGLGIQIVSESTDYGMTNGWSETFLTEESFCALYREFFMEELIPNHTYPENHTVTVLQEIIRELEEMQKK